MNLNDTSTNSPTTSLGNVQVPLIGIWILILEFKGLYTLTSTVIQVWGPEVIILQFLIPILYSPVTGLFGVSSVHVKQVFSFCCCGVMLKLVYSCKMIGPFLCTDSNFRWPVKGWNAIVCANRIMGIQAVLYEGTVRRNWKEEIE